MPSPPDRPLSVLVLGTSFELVSRLRRVLGAGVEVVSHARLVDAVEAFAERTPIAVLLEPTDARGASALPLLEASRRADPELPVIAIVRRAIGWSAPTIALLDARPTAISVEEDFDLTSVVRSLASRIQRVAMVSRVWPQVMDAVPEALRPVVRAALERAASPLRVDEIAGVIGVHRKTLWSLCRRHGARSAQEMLTWCRLLAVSDALRMSAGPIDRIAEELEFASPTALRNSIRRHLGTTASVLRTERGARMAAEGFTRWLSASSPPPVTMSDVA